MNLIDTIKESMMTEQLSELLANGECEVWMFENANEEVFSNAFFKAIDNYNAVNESSKTIIDYIKDAQDGKTVDEGVIGGVLGAIGGIAFGPKIGKAICNVLNLKDGPLYDLFTSRLVTTAICLKLGLRA